MHVIRGHYHRNSARAGRYVQYISHREEGLPRGERREIYGVGERYKDIARTLPEPPQRERAYARLIQQDAQEIRRPVFHQRVFTVDDKAAAQLGSMPRTEAERELRGALVKALRGLRVGRQIQGIYAVHWHGGKDRPAHPHIHALFSPLRRDGYGLYLSRLEVRALWKAWSREVDRTLALAPRYHRGSIPTWVDKTRVEAWVRGTTTACDFRKAPLLQALRSYQPLTLVEARQQTGEGKECSLGTTLPTGLARDAVDTLLRLAVQTALRSQLRPVTAIARALHGRSRSLRPEP
jgi:hypothetical protein